MIFPGKRWKCIVFSLRYNMDWIERFTILNLHTKGRKGELGIFHSTPTSWWYFIFGEFSCSLFPFSSESDGGAVDYGFKRTFRYEAKGEEALSNTIDTWHCRHSTGKGWGQLGKIKRDRGFSSAPSSLTKSSQSFHSQTIFSLRFFPSPLVAIIEGFCPLFLNPSSNIGIVSRIKNN